MNGETVERLDLYLTGRGLAKSRTRAKEMIENGLVLVNGGTVRKPAFEPAEGDEISVLDEAALCPYVSRGGLKLEKAINEFGLSVNDKICLDAGASTGGFTDCLLRHGAKKVYAVDVGHSQLDKKLSENPKVTAKEGVNVRYLDKADYPDEIDLITADLSFISLTKVMESLGGVLAEGGEAVFLIKPQFECGPYALDRHGYVKDKKDHIEAINCVISSASAAGLHSLGLCHSPLRGGQSEKKSGGTGNIEYLLYCKKESGTEIKTDTADKVRKAFEEM